MPNILSVDTSLTHKWFTNPNFRAFVIDFYSTLWIDTVDSTLENIFEVIFWDSNIYKKFLNFCKENNFSFIESTENKNVNIAVILLAFEQAKFYIEQGVTQSVWKILWLRETIIDLEFANHTIPDTQGTFLSWLINSAHRNNMLNSTGEVIYYLGEEFGYQMVYSRERGVHYVDWDGNVIDLIEYNINERIEILWELSENFTDVLLAHQSEFTDEEALRLRELRSEFEESTRTEFLGTLEEEFRFKSWVLHQYRESLLLFENVKAEDVRKTSLSLVWWTVVWDWEWVHLESSNALKRRKSIRLVK